MEVFNSVHSFQLFSRKVSKANRYFFDEETQAFLDTVLTQGLLRIEKVPAGSIFWRAQLGHAWERLYQEDLYIGDIPAPYLAERMKPLLGRAIEGRANPKGIPYLYGASKKKTALSEVRPWLGAIISLAQFKINRNSGDTMPIFEVPRNSGDTYLFLKLFANKEGRLTTGGSKPFSRMGITLPISI